MGGREGGGGPPHIYYEIQFIKRHSSIMVRGASTILCLYLNTPTPLVSNRQNSPNPLPHPSGDWCDMWKAPGWISRYSLRFSAWLPSISWFGYYPVHSINHSVVLYFQSVLQSFAFLPIWARNGLPEQCANLRPAARSQQQIQFCSFKGTLCMNMFFANLDSRRGVTQNPKFPPRRPNIASGETSPGITPFHFFGYSNF